MTKVEKKGNSLVKRIGIGLGAVITFGGLGLIFAICAGLFKDEKFIESAITATEHIKTSGDGYEIVQNPF